MKKLSLLLLCISLIFSCVDENCISGNCENGYGTYVFEGEWEGDRYVGEFKNNMFHGQGTYTFNDGTVIKGLFETDEFIGEK